MPSTWQVGRKLEVEVEEMFLKQGYKTWKPQKMKFASQDVLGIADIVATSPQAFVLLAVAKNRAQSDTIRKIAEMLPYLPKYIIVKYYIYKEKQGVWEIRTWNE